MSTDDKLYTPGDWFENARRDLQRVDERLEENECADAAFLLQQSLEKYLKGYLVSKGWELKRTHDVGDLLDEVTNHNSEYAPYKDLCRVISDYYFFEWSPSPDKVPPKDNIERVKLQAQELISKITGEVQA
ncbi:MAG: HEPN domain-containing protein [Gemmatimonadota bacterium]|nr:MAG: HEPN domain-containing protein [Gemmatimonadota bacterium]